GRVPMTRPSRKSTPCSYCLTTRTASEAASSARTTTTTMIQMNAMRRDLRSVRLPVDDGLDHRGPERDSYSTPVQAVCRWLCPACLGGAGWTNREYGENVAQVPGGACGRPSFGRFALTDRRS